MGLENLSLVRTNDFPIKHDGEVHNGKVRSVYWLPKEDSQRIIEKKGYSVHPTTSLGVMIISDRLSAFECIWEGKEGLRGVPGKGAALNAVSKYWFKKFDEEGLAGNHLLESPHPLVWIVQKAEPVMVEAIARQYITGSMWREYKKGERVFCGIELPEGLKEHQKLDKLLITPTTKGVLKGIPGVKEEDDTNVTQKQIMENYEAFGFKYLGDVGIYERLLTAGFNFVSDELKLKKKILADGKFEMGYLRKLNGDLVLGYIDESPTPDSVRILDSKDYEKGKIIEESKEGFRQFLLEELGIDKDILLNKKRMEERKETARNYRVPVGEMMKVSKTYKDFAEILTGEKVPGIGDARREIIEVLLEYSILD